MMRMFGGLLGLARAAAVAVWAHVGLEEVRLVSGYKALDMALHNVVNTVRCR